MTLPSTALREGLVVPPYLPRRHLGIEDLSWFGIGRALVRAIVSEGEDFPVPVFVDPGRKGMQSSAEASRFRSSDGG